MDDRAGHREQGPSDVDGSAEPAVPVSAAAEPPDGRPIEPQPATLPEPYLILPRAAGGGAGGVAAPMAYLPQQVPPAPAVPPEPQPPADLPLPEPAPALPVPAWSESALIDPAPADEAEAPPEPEPPADLPSPESAPAEPAVLALTEPAPAEPAPSPYQADAQPDLRLETPAEALPWEADPLGELPIAEPGPGMPAAPPADEPPPAPVEEGPVEDEPVTAPDEPEPIAEPAATAPPADLQPAEEAREPQAPPAAVPAIEEDAAPDPHPEAEPAELDAAALEPAPDADPESPPAREPEPEPAREPEPPLQESQVSVWDAAPPPVPPSPALPAFRPLIPTVEPVRARAAAEPEAPRLEPTAPPEPDAAPTKPVLLLRPPPIDHAPAPRFDTPAPVVPFPLPRAPAKAPLRPYLRRAVRGVAVLVLGYFAVLMTLVVAYRWVDPPISALMLGQWLTGTTIQQRWTPLERISPNLRHAVIISEDGSFCRHHGVDWGELADAIDNARDGIARGGSTITMQVVKNLFLWPSRSYLRKAIEIPTAYLIDAAWSKGRILEIYLNIAEWGPGIFGAEAAALYHFRKPPSLLTPREAALLAVSLPNPFDREAGSPGPGTVRLAENLLVRMRGTQAHAGCVRTPPSPGVAAQGRR